VLWTDAVKLQMVLRNLVENSIKFTPRGGVALEVSTRQDGVEFAVSDTGIGIAAELRATIFEPFRRGNGFTPYDGLGLGLQHRPAPRRRPRGGHQGRERARPRLVFPRLAAVDPQRRHLR
jgi:light-regulated signal transduction histidine kinase (bacteriophytochrome)